MIIYVDIDNTITIPYSDIDEHDNLDYMLAKPNTKNIDKVNAMYDAGHVIVYWTARGVMLDKDLREITQRQLNLWGAKYHELKMGKPYYDIYIDDKSINTRDWEMLP